jgi:hypothetical protein
MAVFRGAPARYLLSIHQGAKETLMDAFVPNGPLLK